jgi:hypothetical protein
MTKAVTYMGYSFLLDDDEDLLQPEDQLALFSILEKSEMVDMQIVPNDDGTFIHKFNYRIPKAEIAKLKKAP